MNRLIQTPSLRTSSPTRRALGAGGVLGLLAVALVLMFALGLVGCSVKHSTKTPVGTFHLLMQAAKARDAATMKTFCAGMAVMQCEQLLAAIAEMENTGKASKFDSWNPSTGPAPTGNNSNAFADLFGVGKDLFMRVSVTRVRDDKGEWKVDAIVWESKREE